MRHLIARYPAFYQGSPEFRDIQDALEPEVLALWTAADGIAAQLDVETATWGLKYWEQTIGIPAEAGKDIGFRRSRIRAKLRGAGVTTAALIRDTSTSFSNGDVDVTEIPAESRIEIKFIGTLGVPPNMEDLTAALREAMPAHLQWDYVYLYNTWADAQMLTWGRAAALTWRQLRGSELS